MLILVRAFPLEKVTEDERQRLFFENNRMFSSVFMCASRQI